jgi:hypothetical protein
VRTWSCKTSRVPPLRLVWVQQTMDDEEDLLIARPPTSSNDVLGVLCRWGGLLVAVSLLAYAGFLISS